MVRGITHGSTPPVPGIQRTSGDVVPDRLYINAPGLDRNQCMVLSRQAKRIAKEISPKLSGRMAEGIETYAGEGYFGLRFDNAYTWYQENGIKGFTMRSLAGKTIPMWIDDLDGRISRENPRAQTRVTQSGKRQVKIFRKAAPLGSRKRVAVRDGQGRLVRYREVPRSYPGAPGRIQRRIWNSAGQLVIARGNVGVRWRHPGIVGREFLHYSLQTVAASAGIEGDLQVYATYKRR